MGEETSGVGSATPEMGVHAPDVLHAGTHSELRVLLQAAFEKGRIAPLPRARVTAVLDVREAGRLRLGEAVTDADGVGVLSLDLPEIEPGLYWLAVRAETACGPVELRHELRVRANARLLLAPDAHRVRPGATAGVRLALQRAIPPVPIAEGEIRVSVLDPRGNPVMSRRVVTDRAGGARVELPIAAGAPAGAWTVAAEHRGRTERCVFRVSAPLPSSHAAPPPPAEPVTVRFFPAGGGIVPEVPRELFVHVCRADGRPARGRLTVTIAPPGPLPETPLDAPIDLGADGWGLAIARVARAFLRPAIAAGGHDLEYAAQGFQDARRRNPAVVRVRWHWTEGDAGHSGEAEIDAFPVDEPLTLSLEREIVEPGGTLPVRVDVAGADGPVFVDLLCAGQVVQACTLRAVGGCARGTLAVPAGGEGLLEVRAYRTAGDSRLVEDTRMAHVRPRGVLAVELEATAEITRPAVVWDRVNVRVRDTAGKPVAASVDVALAPAVDPTRPGSDGTEPWVERALELRGHEPLANGADCPGFAAVLRAFALDARDAAAVEPNFGRRAYLALLPARSHYGWSVDPAAERRRRRIAQLERLFSNLVGYMERHPFAQADAGSGRWGYVPDLLERLMREGRLLREDLLDPTGRPYAMSDLEALDPLFRFGYLVRAITGVRIRRVYEALAEYGRRHEKWSWVRRPYWDYPEDVAEQLLREGLIEEAFLRDGWDRPLSIQKRETPVEPEQLPRGLAQVRVVSGGPDGVFTPGVDPEQPLSSVLELPLSAIEAEPEEADDEPSESALDVPAGGADGSTVRDRGAGGSNGDPGPGPNGADAARDRAPAALGSAARDAGAVGTALPAGVAGGAEGTARGDEGVPAPADVVAAALGARALSPAVAATGRAGGSPDPGRAGIPRGSSDTRGLARSARRIAWPIPPQWSDRVEDPEALLPEEDVRLDPFPRAHVATVTAAASGEIPPLEVPVPESGEWMLVAVARAPSGEVGAAILRLAAEPRPRVELSAPPPVSTGDRFSLEARVFGAPEASRLLPDLEAVYAPRAESAPVPAGDPTTVALAVHAPYFGDHEAGVVLVDAGGVPRSRASTPVTVRAAATEVEEAFGLPLRPGRTLAFPWPAGATAQVRTLAGPLHLALEAWRSTGREPIVDLDGALLRATASARLLAALRAQAVSWPEPEARAEADALGALQEILARESIDGGFAWFAGGPAHPLLSARTLLALRDLGAVLPVDRAVVERTAAALQRAQDRDGCWTLTRDAGGWDSLSARFVPTAYVTWALAAAGVRDPAFDRAAAWLRKRVRDAGHDPYARAVVLGALLEREPADAALTPECERLAGLARVEDGTAGGDAGEASWGPGGLTPFGTWGADARTETTAWAVLALRRFPQARTCVAAGCMHLLRMRDAAGGWGPAHVTEACLRALAACDSWDAPHDGSIPRVRVNGQELDITPDDDREALASPRSCPVPATAADARFEAEVLSGVGLPLSVVVRHTVAWDERPAPPARGAAVRTSLALAVRLARAAVPLGEKLDVELQLDHVGSTPVWRSAVLVELPPGLEPDPAALAALVAEGKLLAVSHRPGGLRLDAGLLKPKERRVWKLPLVARARGRVRVPPAMAFEVYGPQVRAVAGTAIVEVT